MNDLARLQNFARRRATLLVVMQTSIEQTVADHREWFADRNRAYMADMGETVAGKNIQSGGYSPGYQTYKKRYGRFKNTAYVDLKLMGDFHQSIHLDYEGNLAWNMKSSDLKAVALEKKYGKLLGIRDEDAKEFIQDILLPRLKLAVVQHLTV